MKISIKMGNYEAILDMDFVKLEPVNSNVKLDGEDILISIKGHPGNPESFAEVTTGTVQDKINVRKSQFIEQQEKSL
ncbi:MAG: hypothetical protein MR924_13680 [Prevotella sp.]|nr:hypothetical protein [Prevotella sp.]